MWRLPPRPGLRRPTRTRSLWFGLVPTYSADHWTDEPDGTVQPKLDDRAIYELRCIVTQPPAAGSRALPAEALS